MEGILLKKRRVVKGWRERNFAVDGVTLTYRYPNSNLCRSYQFTKNSYAREHKSNGKPCFIVNVVGTSDQKEEVLVLRTKAEDFRKFDDWLEAFHAASMLAKQDTPKANINRNSQVDSAAKAPRTHIATSQTQRLVGASAVIVLLLLLHQGQALTAASFCLGLVAATVYTRKNEYDRHRQGQVSAVGQAKVDTTSEGNEGEHNRPPIPDRREGESTNAELYLADARKATEKLLAAVQRDPIADGWKPHRSKAQNLDVYLKEEQGLMYAMGRCVIDAPLHVLLHGITDPTCKQQLDALWKSQSVVESFDPDAFRIPQEGADASNMVCKFLKVIYSQYKSAYMLAPREVCTITATLTDETTGSVCIASRSVEHPKCPETENVRVNVAAAGYYLVPQPPVADKGGDLPERTLVVNVTAMHPGGAVPTWIVERMAPQRAMVVDRLGKLPLVKNRNLWPSQPK